MPRYGLPNPTKGVTNLSRGSRRDIKSTNPSATKKGFSVPGTAPKLKPDYGYTPHKMGAKTLKIKTSGKPSMGK